MKAFSFILFILIFSVENLRAESPWARSSERSSPWGGVVSSASAEKAENRTQFFKRLNEPQKSRPEIYKQTPVTKMEQLPWESYEQEWDGGFAGEFLWPVTGGKISSGFGIRHGRPHEGLDIKQDVGSEIKAAAAGKVVFSGWMHGYGRTLVISHGSSYSTVYAHNESNLVERGQIVQRGQAIAKLGSSGRTSGPHLHFEVRQDGKPVNPLRFHYEGRWDPS